MTLLLLMNMMIFSLLDASISFHPLILSLKVLLFALILCSTVGLTTTWYDYMSFMIMLGGVLVMFTYISSLAPNSIYSSKVNLPLLISQVTISLLMSYDLSKLPQKSFNTQSPISPPENFITFFLSSSNCSILLIMTSALLLTVLIITNLLSNSNTAMVLAKYCQFINVMMLKYI